MMTVKQVALLTGVSVRTLQFYDEIGLLKPTKLTDAGYRLYDEDSLEVLQQILFFKELDFTLKEIKGIMDNPLFDRKAVFEKQRDLIQMKRDRLDGLLGMLDRLIKGEKCMEFKGFDMSEYFRVLSEFRETHGDEIREQMGSIESFDEMISDMRAREEEIARLAVKQHGSLENFTRSMEKNFGKFLSEGPAFSEEEVSKQVDKTDEITRRLTADLEKDPADPGIQEIMGELIAFVNESNQGLDVGDNYWGMMADLYKSNPAFAEAADKKYGKGASRFIGMAIQEFFEK